MLYRVFDIKYDVDSDGEETDLPKELFLTTEDSSEPVDELSDLISDNTGFCHKGFDYEEVGSTFSYGFTPSDLITKAVKSQCPHGYPMVIRDKDEWSAIAAAVNKGIDSHLEAITERSKIDNGVCLIHPDELHVLLRRFDEDGGEEAMGLRMSILITLGIEEI